MVVGLKNWRQLTNFAGEFKAGPMAQGLAEARAEKVSILLATEVGETKRTARPEGLAYQGDFTTVDRAVPGRGVGAFWGHQWHGKWAMVSSDKGKGNWRIFLVREGGTSA